MPDSAKKRFASCCSVPVVELHVPPVHLLAMLARGWSSCAFAEFEASSHGALD
jgi:hypothetical protein